LPASYKCRNLSYITTLHERHHLETQVEVAARAVARVACHSLAPVDQLAYACENYLPADIMDQVKEYERSEKLNPPMEKRTKSIPVAEIEKDTQKVQREAEGRGVLIESAKLSETIDDLPIYK